MKKNELRQDSFRDPDGFVFKFQDKVFRQINKSYKEEYDFLITSGLYKLLAKKEYLVKHKELKNFPSQNRDDLYKIILPEQIPFVSYPYEWSFSQLKDAALLTLEILKTALDYNMILKDASSYNVQFLGGKPIFIDTLSFSKYNENEPWIAYRQFCKHFLAPLALISYCDFRVNLLSKSFIDGIPLDLASKLLPLKSKFNLALLTHLHFHAKSQEFFAGKKLTKKKVTKLGLLGIVSNLEAFIRNLKYRQSTEWENYYKFTNYSKVAFLEKKKIVSLMVKASRPKIVWDVGANTGVFSEISAKQADLVISFDNDANAVEKNYLRLKDNKIRKILPLIVDLTSPSPSLGWQNKERMSLIDRGPADTTLALAIIHHLAISNNLPFGLIASFFSKITRNLIIEFIPKTDSQIKKLLATRKDIFDQYNELNFENIFSSFFRIRQKKILHQSKRVIYLMEKK